MLVYRIVHQRYAAMLSSPGVAGRWNRAGSMVIYTSFSRSLACLESMVHRSSAELSLPYRVMVIEIPDRIAIAEIDVSSITGNWYSPEGVMKCREMGENWLRSNRGGVLKVPSVVVHAEYNYLIHMRHPDFKEIRMVATEGFVFDPRLSDYTQSSE